jgi:hypothetical protein
MKGSAWCNIVFCVCQWASAYAQGGLEQYAYLQKGESPTFVPIVHIQNKKWYGEARYNYEELKTFSAYVGKIFSGDEGSHSYAIIPVIGIVMGKFKGGSVGLDVTFNDGDFFFCSQSQYTFSKSERYQNFMYSWSELGYEPSKWFYAGLALQHTQLFQKSEEPISYEFGAMAGLKLGRLTIPFYSFSPFAIDRYFLVGVNFGFEKNSKRHIR